MAKQKNIKLTELLEACMNFTKDPTPANELKVVEMTQIFTYREYIPMTEKQIQIATIISHLPEDDNDALLAENWLAMGKVVYGILPYIVNLENDLNAAALTPAVVDLLYKMEIIDKILNHCEKDYKRFETMLSETLNFSNIFRLAQTAEIMNGDKLEQFVSDLRQFTKELDPDLLKKLHEIAVSGSPELAVVKEGIYQEALVNVKKDAENTEKAETKDDTERHDA